MDIFHPFLGNDQVQVCIMSFMILFYSKLYMSSETNRSTKMENIIYGIKTYNDKAQVCMSIIQRIYITSETNESTKMEGITIINIKR